MSKAALGRVLSEETRARLSELRKGIGGKKVWVTNIKTGESQQYESLSEAARDGGC